ncbi:hypothetical protein BDF22DRAFT_652281 [Syncephalis plumigaleata]|nr:hypothetical protein BDF22DRAFT_652281 [Syncephalis plumigaleata]
MRIAPIVVLLCQVAVSTHHIHAASVPTRTTAAHDVSQLWVPAQSRYSSVPLDVTLNVIHRDDRDHHRRIERRKLELPSPKKIYNNVIDKVTDRIAGAFRFIVYNELEIDLNTLRDLLYTTENTRILKELVEDIRDTLASAIIRVRDWFSKEYQDFVANFIAEKTRFLLRKQLYWKGTEPVPSAVSSTNCLSDNSTNGVVMLSANNDTKLPDGAVACKPIPAAVSTPSTTTSLSSAPPAKPTTGVLGVIRKISDSVAVGLIMRSLTKPLRLAVDQSVKLSTGLIHHTIYKTFILALHGLVRACKVVVGPAQLGLNAIDSAVNTAKKVGESARKWVIFSTDSLIAWLKHSSNQTKTITDNMLNNVKHDNQAIANNVENGQSKDATISDKMDISELSLSLKNDVSTVPSVTVEGNLSHLASLNSKCDKINGVFQSMWESIEGPIKTAVDRNTETLSTRLQDQAVDQLKKDIQLAINDIVPVYPEIAAGQKD